MRGAGLGLGVSAAACAPGWSPRAAGGLVLDFDPSAGITLAVSKVSAWADQSQSALSAVQGADANRPTFVASDVNGRPGVRGAAAAKLTIAGFPTLTAMTLFVVATKTILNTAYLLSGPGDWGIIENFGTGWEWFNGSDRLTFSAAPTAGAHVLAVTQVNAGALSLYCDGAQAATKATAATNISPIACLFNASSGLGNGYGGDILRVLTFSRVMGGSELAHATQALKTEWAIQ